jgi:hypothetical protein
MSSPRVPPVVTREEDTRTRGASPMRSSNERLLKRVPTQGYLDRSPTHPSHEQVAHGLALSRAAYFRRLRVAADRVADHLAQST